MEETRAPKKEVKTPAKEIRRGHGDHEHGAGRSVGSKRDSVDDPWHRVGSAAASLGASLTTGKSLSSSARPPSGRGKGHHPSPSPHEGTPHVKPKIEKEKALSLLNKKFTFKPHGVSIKPSDLFSSEPFTLPALLELKTAVNAEKDKLDRLDLQEWERHSQQVNRAGGVIPHLRNTIAPELCTIAWTKMYETLVTMRLVADQIHPGAQLVSAHLCEAPGAFVCALNHYMRGPGGARPEWSWLASTLNPYYEGHDSLRMNDDDILIAQTYKNWWFGSDNSGDIRKQENIRSIWAKVRELPGGEEGAHLATGDGAIDTQVAPNEQEMINATLHYCELIAALGCLRKGGSLMIKSFSMFEHPMVCKLFLLTALFDEFTVFKPSTSKAANSETYLIGKGFKGIDPPLLEALLSHCSEAVFKVGTPEARALLPLSLMPQEFLQQMVACARMFSEQQIRTLKEAVELMAPHNKAAKDSCWRTRGWFGEEWVKRMGLGPLDPRDQLTNSGLKGNRNNTSIGVLSKLKFAGTLEQRKTEIERRDHLLGTSGPSSVPSGASLPSASAPLAGVSPKWRLRAEATPFVPSGNSPPQPSPPVGPERPPSGPRKIIGFASESPDGGDLSDLVNSDFGHHARTAPHHSHHPSTASTSTRKSQELSRHSPAPPRTPPRSELTAGVLSAQKVDRNASAAPRPSLDLKPDCVWLENEAGPVTAEESQDWAPTTCGRVPLLRSKTCDDEALCSLIALRRAAPLPDADASAPSSRSPCSHTGPCSAPPPPPSLPGETLDRGYWKLRALDHALGFLKGLVTEARSGADRALSTPCFLDLSASSHAGAAHYLGTRGEQWTMLHVREEGASVPSSLEGRAVRRSFERTAGDSDAVGEWVRVTVGGGGVDLVISSMGSYSERYQGGPSCCISSVEMELRQSDRLALLHEALVTLKSLREGGAAVFRVGDLFTRFTNGVLFLLHRCFARMCLAKPFTSCAACGEKFLVFQGFLGQRAAAEVLVYLTGLAKQLETQPADITFADALPPPAWIGKPFYKYVASRVAQLVRLEAAALKALVPRKESVDCSANTTTAETYFASPLDAWHSADHRHNHHA